MSKTIELTAADGHRLSAWLGEPRAKPRGGVVVIQEIFGVTAHIRAVTDQYAAAGFLAVAPALFDRIERDVDVPYADVARGRGYMQALQNEAVMLDVAAAIDRVAPAGKVGVVGYCWGGTIAFLAAARLPIAAAVSYYGGGTTRHLAEKPRCPVMYHYGDLDSHIPMSAVQQVKAADPGGIFHIYHADHGFNCTDRASFEPASAKLALERSLEFFHQHIG
ncbi:MAG: dienelactone hydrolase family protein [Gammaproteobacteria bacterium]|nr:dienelactone hydrolase family protein [Gammaproteobacteria bacterium]MDE2349206.1 dienelactone hydrolase family protein [Gammaproteobacteria bacterium]